MNFYRKTCFFSLFFENIESIDSGFEKALFFFFDFFFDIRIFQEAEPLKLKINVKKSSFY